MGVRRTISQMPGVGPLVRGAVDYWLAQQPFFRAYPPPMSARLIDTRVAISPEYRFAYFRVPKAANTTVMHTLRVARDEGRARTTRAKEGYVAPSQLDAAGLAVFQRDYYRFTVVRHPVTRALSAYLEKIASGKSAFREGMVARRLGGRVRGEFTVGDFVTYLEAGGVADDPHWSLQRAQICLPLEAFHHIGKVETLGEDMPVITKAIFGRTFELTDWRKHRTDATAKARSLLDDSLIERLGRLYAADMAAFGYEPDGF